MKDSKIFQEQSIIGSVHFNKLFFTNNNNVKIIIIIFLHH